MPGAHAHNLPKTAVELNPAEAAKQDELALRKMVRASAGKNVRLNECMMIVRKIQNNFERQCRRMDRLAKEVSGDKKAKKIRADMLTRQHILSAQWDEAHKERPGRHATHARKFQRRAQDSPQDDPEPISNPKMILGKAHAVKKHKEDYDDGRIPRFMDTVKNYKGTEVSQEERATLLAMGASEGQGDDNGEEVAIATFQPPHWTSMLAKEWQLREKEAEAEDAAGPKRPHTARSGGAPQPSRSRAGARDAAGHPTRGSQTARPSTARVAAFRASRPGTAESAAGAPRHGARRPGTAAASSAHGPMTMEAAEMSAVQAVRSLHHSVQHVFEETPIAFHDTGQSNASARHEEASSISLALPEDVQSGAPFSPDRILETPRLQVRKPSYVEIDGMNVKASSVMLPPHAITRQLYHEHSKHGDRPKFHTGHHTSYVPLNRWNPASALGSYHPFLDNRNLRLPPSTDPVKVRPPGPSTASTFVHAESVVANTGDADDRAAWSPGPMLDRGFSRVTPRSNASSRVQLKLNLPKADGGSRPTSARSPRPWSSPERSPRYKPVSRTVSEEERDDLIEESRRVLAREVREQEMLSGAAAASVAAHSLPYSGRSARGERSVHATPSLDLSDLALPRPTTDGREAVVTAYTELVGYDSEEPLAVPQRLLGRTGC